MPLAHCYPAILLPLRKCVHWRPRQHLQPALQLASVVPLRALSRLPVCLSLCYADLGYRGVDELASVSGVKLWEWVSVGRW